MEHSRELSWSLSRTPEGPLAVCISAFTRISSTRDTPHPPRTLRPALLPISAGG